MRVKKIGIFVLFLAFFFANFATIKKPAFKNLSVCIILVQNATFVLNRPSQSSGIVRREKTVTHPPRHPAYYTIRECQ